MSMSTQELLQIIALAERLIASGIRIREMLQQAGGITPEQWEAYKRQNDVSLDEAIRKAGGNLWPGPEGPADEEMPPNPDESIYETAHAEDPSDAMLSHGDRVYRVRLGGQTFYWVTAANRPTLPPPGAELIRTVEK